MLKTEVVHK